MRAVLLDAFGTLVRMDEPGARLQAELAVLGIHVDADRARRAFAAEIAYYLRHHMDGRDERSLDRLRDRCADVLRETLAEPALDRASARRAMLASIRFGAYPDARPALEALRSRHLTLVVASNWDCSLPRVLKVAELADLVDRVVTSAGVGAAKPDRRFFAAALRVAGCEPRDALYVGDSPENDVEGARAAGLRAVLVRRVEGRPPAIARLTELPSLIFEGRRLGTPGDRE